MVWNSDEGGVGMAVSELPSVFHFFGGFLPLTGSGPKCKDKSLAFHTICHYTHLGCSFKLEASAEGVADVLLSWLSGRAIPSFYKLFDLGGISLLNYSPFYSWLEQLGCKQQGIVR